MASSTREKILAVSLRLFNEQGYRNVTMRAIADALSISVGNLTYHFAKKQDIVAALMDDVFAQMTATADMPAASLAQIDSLFSMMLDTLERCAFFFLDNELKQENGPLHLAHHTHLRAPDRRAERARRTGLFYRILHAGGLPDADSNPADEPHDVA